MKWKSSSAPEGGVRKKQKCKLRGDLCKAILLDRLCRSSRSFRRRPVKIKPYGTFLIPHPSSARHHFHLLIILSKIT